MGIFRKLLDASSQNTWKAVISDDSKYLAYDIWRRYAIKVPWILCNILYDFLKNSFS